MGIMPLAVVAETKSAGLEYLLERIPCFHGYELETTFIYDNYGFLEKDPFHPLGVICKIYIDNLRILLVLDQVQHFINSVYLKNEIISNFVIESINKIAKTHYIR